MTRKIRKQIYLRADQDRRLKQLAKQLGVSEAELIRQSVDQAALGAAAPRPDLGAWQAEVRFIRARRSKGRLPGRRDWKREELYQRGRLSRH
ncbi:MAG: ribbon-helix-helix protein, CopG family [Gemmatimonadetes bacterium]|nr:ribbon-helix-helix protein, CopG family [Gemmatimonadota bacterium]